MTIRVNNYCQFVCIKLPNNCFCYYRLFLSTFFVLVVVPLSTGPESATFLLATMEWRTAFGPRC
jgi:hypothetical protein